MALSQITDLFARAKLRMLLQYRALTLFVGDLGALSAEAQAVEDAFWAFYGQLNLDNAAGVWLERLAGLVGETRDGAPDDGDGIGILGLRQIAKARIIANKSTGSSEDVLATAAAAVAPAAGVDLSLVDWYPAAQALTVTSSGTIQFDPTAINRFAKLIGRARAICVQTMVLYQDDSDDGNIFVCGDALGSDPQGLGFDNAASPDDPSAGRLSGAVNT